MTIKTTITISEIADVRGGEEVVLYAKEGKQYRLKSRGQKWQVGSKITVEVEQKRFKKGGEIPATFVELVSQVSSKPGRVQTTEK